MGRRVRKPEGQRQPQPLDCADCLSGRPLHRCSLVELVGIASHRFDHLLPSLPEGHRHGCRARLRPYVFRIRHLLLTDVDDSDLAVRNHSAAYPLRQTWCFDFKSGMGRLPRTAPFRCHARLHSLGCCASTGQPLRKVRPLLREHPAHAVQLWRDLLLPVGLRPHRLGHLVRLQA